MHDSTKLVFEKQIVSRLRCIEC